MIRCKLSDLLDTRSGSTPLTTNDKYYKNGRIPWLTSGEISQGIIRNNEHFVTEVALKNTSLQIIPKESTLIAMYGATVGQVGFLTFDSTINQAICAIMPNKNVADPRYVYYYFTCHGQSFKDLAAGSARTNISQATIQNFPLTLPGMKCQHRIAELLSTMDESITASDGITLQLVDIMHLIYDYWFVQFNFPDENGRPYKSSGGKMVYNDQLKQEIPEGWTVATLADVFLIKQPEQLSKANMSSSPGKHRVYGSNGIIGSYSKYNYTDSVIAVSCRGNCGNVYRTMPKSWVTSNAMVVTPLSKTVTMHNAYIMALLESLNLKSATTGSIQGQITWINLSKIKIVIPKMNTLDTFNRIADPMYELQIILEDEATKLTSLRDWLLPMLMNGQVEIKND